MLRAEIGLRQGDFELDLALEVEPGRCLAVAGPSGSGKTTALRAIAGLLAPERGRIACGEALWLDTAARVNLAPERRRCGYVFQQYALFEHQRVWENVAYGLRRRSRHDRRWRATAMLDRFGLAERAMARPRALSGGERQRVALARALATDPLALLLDEPLSALDATTRRDAGQVLASVLAELRVPAIIVTHDFAEAALFGDVVAVVDRGRVVQRGTAAELAAVPANAFVADFCGAVVLRGMARPGADGGTIVELPSGGQVSSVAAAAGPVAASVYPWEISLEPPGELAAGSIRNHLPATVESITPVGGRVRVGLAASQPLSAEITEAASREMGLRKGSRVIASWKATATRLSPS
jgi:molybdate transport system ATP-binding protein